jgi:hypothetical protein
MSVAGSGSKSAQVGDHSLTGSGAFDAEHSKGSTTGNASGQTAFN